MSKKEQEITVIVDNSEMRFETNWYGKKRLVGSKEFDKDAEKAMKAKASDFKLIKKEFQNSGILQTDEGHTIYLNEHRVAIIYTYEYNTGEEQ